MFSYKNIIKKVFRDILFKNIKVLNNILIIYRAHGPHGEFTAFIRRDLIPINEVEYCILNQKIAEEVIQN